jgi:nucleotide-binding universal stress UspA family protein
VDDMTVLAAWNDSPHGEVAVRTALAEAARRRLPLAVLDLDPQPADAPVPAALATLLDAAPPDVKIEPVAFRTADQEPADAIVDAARAADATLVVLGTRRRPGAFLLGTTTQRVLLDSAVPVLVVKDAYGA